MSNRKLKQGYKDDYYLYPLTDDFPINENYFLSILEDLENKNLIKGLKITKSYRGVIVDYDLSDLAITIDGIDYLRNNSKIKKLINVVKEARTIMSFWR